MQRRYLPASNVLETTFITTNGTLVLTDLMPVSFGLVYPSSMVPTHELIRHVECTDGEVELAVSFAPRLDYGRDRVALRRQGKLGIRMDVGKATYWLRTDLPLSLSDSDAEAQVPMKCGSSFSFSFSFAQDAPAVLPPTDENIENRIQESVRWWQDWVGGIQYDGEYREHVIRSALALKLLTFVPSGAVIAAPTTSLPEQVGGSLNWDYRFCWLRDASLTIRALIGLGFWDEATNFLGWMLHATRLTQPELKILYTVFGESPGRERELTYLSGYRNSQPVRVGNAARDQLQLDVYGEVVDAAAQFVFQGGFLDRDMQKTLVGFGDYVCKNWNQPDEGIWEPRAPRQHHTHSRLLCWTTLDRLISLQNRGAIQGVALDRYAENRERIRKEIYDQAWSEKLESYVSILGGDALDASLLLLSWYGFEPADSPRMQTTYRAIRRDLGAGNSLLYRYRTVNREGAFAICGFWGTEFLALSGGSIHAAKQSFEHLLKYANDLGLFAEEVDPDTGAALGNFPQAFTHVGLISAALSMRRREKGEQQLPHRNESASSRAAVRDEL